MGWMIDGHNLIPYIPGLSLASIDDEIRLVELLQIYSRLKRKDIEVYFDGAPASRAGMRRFGTIKAHFIRAGKTADEAIINRLRQLGKAARNTTVVSSDRRVRSEATGLRASIISSAEFAQELITATQRGEKEPPDPETGAYRVDVDEWLRIFREKPPKTK
jgi:hypothetical protein